MPQANVRLGLRIVYATAGAPLTRHPCPIAWQHDWADRLYALFELSFAFASSAGELRGDHRGDERRHEYAVAIRAGGNVQIRDTRLADERPFERRDRPEADANLLDAARAEVGVDLMDRFVEQAMQLAGLNLGLGVLVDAREIGCADVQAAALRPRQELSAATVLTHYNAM